MTVAIYARVSTDEQSKEGFGLDVQKERLVAFCVSQGWDDYKLYIDDGYTGTNMNRPALKRMLKHIEDGKVNFVVVYKLDRLGRKQKDVLYLLEDVFEKNNVAFKSATEPFDTSTPFGKATIGILAVFAQLERDMIVERTTSGRRQRIDEGYWYGGRSPFGYQWNKDAKTLNIIPEEAHIVKEIYKQYLQGKSRLAIADWAASKTNARVFDHSVIRDILNRPVYMGKLMNAGSLVDGNHEAIIDGETWHMVQIEFSKRSEGLTPIGEYLLTGLLRCGVCDSPIVHVKSNTKRNGKVYSYELYACKNQHVRPKDRSHHCKLGYFRRERIEKQIEEQIKDLAIKQPKKIQEIITKKTNDVSDDTLIDSLKLKLEKVNQSLENLYEAIESGEIKVSAISGRIKKLDEEREMIEKQIDELEEDTPRLNDIKVVSEILKQIGKVWDRANEDERKSMLRKVVKQIVLHKEEEPEIIWNS